MAPANRSHARSPLLLRPDPMSRSVVRRAALGALESRTGRGDESPAPEAPGHGRRHRRNGIGPGGGDLEGAPPGRDRLLRRGAHRGRGRPRLRLGLRYHTPEVALSVVDKGVQRTLAAGAGISGPDFRVVPPGVSIERIGQLAVEVGFPVVLKPARGSGSRGIELAGSYEELLSLLSFRESAGGSIVGVVEELLLDDPVRNPTFASYVSVESVVSHGTVSHVAVTGRFPLASAFRETGNFIPAAEEASTLSAVTTMAGQAIKALGILDSVVHIEIKLTTRRPEVDRSQRPLGWPVSASCRGTTDRW